MNRAKDSGKEMHDLVHHTLPNGLPYPWEECPLGTRLVNGKKIHAPDELFWRADGTSLAVEMWSYPVIHRGRIARSVVTFLDRNRAQAAEHGPASSEREAEAANSAKSEFLATEPRNPDAHERNSGMTALALETELNPGAAGISLGMVKSSGNRCSRS